ncbi:hypothetical protein HK101_010073 [Irineochytrium annulatum]|nr:hypothetical protein HK101_010073 [Irineochytrium annulatum]
MTCADQAAGNSTTHANITTAFEPTSQTVLITCATTTCPADAAIITKAFQGPVTSDCTTIMAAGPSFNSTLPPPTKITTSIPVITGSITGSITAGLPSNAVTASAVVTTTALTTTMNSGANGDRVNPAVAAVMVVAFGAMLL